MAPNLAFMFVYVRKPRTVALFIVFAVGMSSRSYLSSTALAAENQTMDVASLVLFVDGEKSKGSAFVVAEGSRQYIYTNAHVLSWQNDVSFKTSAGKEVKHATQIEIATDRDLARIPILGTPFKNPLRLFRSEDASLKIGEEVEAYGDSGGENVVTRLSGTILGVGPDEIEVDTQIIPGNSGGPIVRKGTNVVVAVATRGVQYVSPWVEETRFGDVRRFGLRPEKASAWQKTTFAKLRSEWQDIQQLNIDTVSIVALTLLVATDKGFYVPENVEFGRTGRVHREEAANQRRNPTPSTTQGNANEQPVGRTYFVDEWFATHRGDGLTKLIWNRLGVINKALGYGSKGPSRAMVEVTRHYASFFSPVFAQHMRGASNVSPTSYTWTHRQDFEEAVAARKAASEILNKYATAIKSGIKETGLSGLR